MSGKTHSLRNGGTGNSGGNEGNAFGAGRPKRVIRGKFLESTGQSAKTIHAITQFKPVIPVYDVNGALKSKRPPTFDEWKWASEISAKYGLGTQDEVLMIGDEAIFEAIGTILPEFVAPDKIPTFIERLKDALGDQS